MKTRDGTLLTVCSLAVASLLFISVAVAAGASSPPSQDVAAASESGGSNPESSPSPSPSPAAEDLKTKLTVPVLPNLNLTAETNGGGELRGGLSIYFPSVNSDKNIDLAFSPFVSIAVVNNTASFAPFKPGANTSYPWKAGASIVLLRVPLELVKSQNDVWQKNPVLLAAKRRSGEYCIAQCKTADEKKKPSQFCEDWDKYSKEMTDEKK